MTISVLVADDQTMLRESFAVLLSAQPDMEVTGEASDGAEAVRLVLELQPHIALMDIRMPIMDGLEATRRIVAAGVRTKVVVLTTFDEDEYVHAAIRAGAAGFLLKDSSAYQLADAIRTTVSGGAVLAPSVTRRLMDDLARKAAPAIARDGRLSVLTEREIGVLCLIAQGLSNLEIAAELFIAEQTVKTHVSRILKKLGLRDRTQAVVLAYELGLAVPRR
ncbi:response regulator transcription factor [Actinoplanes sp. KI2]|uniref:response regulator n=1 Tax=Actinoplanes sp. KI2 TaxID=2983315 RepID=UPI0021D5E0AB|nr:response regulator transcription factor [Actinoplanes sp. KI2]MCU7728842.1 response regulator transcription factor [Actinoplanes sp. KI2]